MAITIYQSYLKRGTKLTRNQLSVVGIKARNLYLQIFGDLPEKQEQREPTSLNYEGKNPKTYTFQVFAYPDEFEPIIFNLIDEIAKKPKKKKKKKQPVEI